MQPCTRGRTASAPYRTSPGRRNGTPSAHNTSPPLHHLPLLPTLWLTIPLESWACCRRDICWRCSTWTRRRNIPTCRKTLFQRRNMICKGADTPDTATACCSKWRTRTWTGRRDYFSRRNKEAGAEPCTPFFFFFCPRLRHGQAFQVVVADNHAMWIVVGRRQITEKKMGLLKILTLCHYAHEKGRMASFEK